MYTFCERFHVIKRLIKHHWIPYKRLNGYFLYFYNVFQNEIHGFHYILLEHYIYYKNKKKKWCAQCKYKTIIAYIRKRILNARAWNSFRRVIITTDKLLHFGDSAVQYYLRCDGRCWNLHICTVFCNELLSIQFALIAINLYVKYNKHG